jgi:hypothetical protein
MSILRVANVHFESTGSSRIDLVGDTVNIVAGGSVVLSANQSQGLIVGKTNVAPAFDQANTAQTIAVSSFAKANLAVINVQTFNASGTWTKPSGYSSSSRVHIQLWGAGGSGSRNNTTTSCSGGGGGGYNEEWLNLSSLGSTETITIGAGGVSRSGTNQDGAAGGTTSVGTIISAFGGGGGFQRGIGGGGGGQLSAGETTTSTSTFSLPGRPYIAAVPGDFTKGNGLVYQGGGVHGSADGLPIWFSTGSSNLISGFWHGGGGGSGSATAALNQGAPSVLGGGGGGGNTTGLGGPSTHAGNGGNAGTTGGVGSEPAGGGGGGSSVSGAGANGRCIITVFPSS